MNSTTAIHNLEMHIVKLTKQSKQHWHRWINWIYKTMIEHAHRQIEAYKVEEGRLQK